MFTTGYANNISFLVLKRSSNADFKVGQGGGGEIPRIIHTPYPKQIFCVGDNESISFGHGWYNFHLRDNESILRGFSWYFNDDFQVREGGGGVGLRHTNITSKNHSFWVATMNQDCLFLVAQNFTETETNQDFLFMNYSIIRVLMLDIKEVVQILGPPTTPPKIEVFGGNARELILFNCGGSKPYGYRNKSRYFVWPFNAYFHVGY